MSLDPLLAIIRDLKFDMIIAVNKHSSRWTGDMNEIVGRMQSMIGCCTPKYPELDQTVQVLEWFKEQRRKTLLIRRKVVLGKRVTLLQEVQFVRVC